MKCSNHSAQNPNLGIKRKGISLILSIISARVVTDQSRVSRSGQVWRRFALDEQKFKTFPNSDIAYAIVDESASDVSIHKKGNPRDLGPR